MTDTQFWLEIAKIAVSALAPFLAALLVFWLGLKSWRKQAVAKRRSELAEECLRIGLDALQNIRGVRQLGSDSAEEKLILKKLEQEGYTEIRMDFRGIGLYAARYFLIRNDIDKLRQYKEMSAILLDDSVAISLQDIINLHQELDSAIRAYGTSAHAPEIAGVNNERPQELSGIIFSTGSSPYQEKLIAAQQNVTNSVKEYITHSKI
ncbi:MAG: hypothetical protein IT557_03910 [Alphaproteobacteria bacterium]|nr:hypothetical protein [Alphaproteobacteria bacterium]